MKPPARAARNLPPSCKPFAAAANRPISAFLPAAVAAALGDAGKEVQASGEINPRQLRRFQPVTSPYEGNVDAPTAAKIALGRQLYFDVRLSKDRDLSCNSCHDLDSYGVDSQPTSTGHKKQHGGRNSPTVFNAALNFSQFWDGRAATLEQQAQGPPLNPIEMGMPNAAAVVERLNGLGFEPLTQGVDELERFIAEDVARNAALLRAANFQPE